jgi:hypothetical protein
MDEAASRNTKRESDIRLGNLREDRLKRLADGTLKWKDFYQQHLKDKLTESKRATNLLSGHRAGMLGVAQGGLALRERAEDFEQDYLSTKMLLESAKFESGLKYRDIARYEGQLEELGTTLRVLYKAAAEGDQTAAAAIPGAIAKHKQLEDQIYNGLGTPAIRDPATGALQGFQQKPVAPKQQAKGRDKFGFTPTDWSTIAVIKKRINPRTGRNYTDAEAQNFVRNDPNR